MITETKRILKYLAATVPILTTAAPTPALPTDWRPLSVNVTDIDAVRGGQLQLFVFLEDGFPIKHEKALRQRTHPVDGTDAAFAIEVPSAEPFALKLHHDEDGSGQVTKNRTGIFPAEGFGFSAGAKMAIAPPTFTDAALTLPESGRVSIPMISP